MGSILKGKICFYTESNLTLNTTLKKLFCFLIFVQNVGVELIVQLKEEQSVLIVENNMSEEKKITFPPTEPVILDKETIDRLLKEGMEFRKQIEKSSRKMFIPNPEHEHIRMR